MWHLLDALKRFDSLDPRRVMEITFEVARLGKSGLDYANPEKKYTLSAYPGESFSGLQLMCLMYAGFKRIAPEQDTGMDLNEPWITALELFNAGKSSSGYLISIIYLGMHLRYATTVSGLKELKCQELIPDPNGANLSAVWDVSPVWNSGIFSAQRKSVFAMPRAIRR